VVEKSQSFFLAFCDTLTPDRSGMTLLTRRELVLAGLAAARTLHSDEPVLSVSGVDHLKVRVASAGASAMFYHGLFGGDILPVSNSTFPDSPKVDEFFLKIGVPPFPYLMVSQIRGGESAGLDHLSLLVGDLVVARSTLARNGISLINPDQGLWFRDNGGTLLELMGANVGLAGAGDAASGSLKSPEPSAGIRNCGADEDPFAGPGQFRLFLQPTIQAGKGSGREVLHLWRDRVTTEPGHRSPNARS
jgi:hypothetical protein